MNRRVPILHIEQICIKRTLTLMHTWSVSTLTQNDEKQTHRIRQTHSLTCTNISSCYWINESAEKCIDCKYRIRIEQIIFFRLSFIIISFHLLFACFRSSKKSRQCCNFLRLKWCEKKENKTQTRVNIWNFPFHLLHQIETLCGIYHVQFSTNKLVKSFMTVMCILWCC